MTLNTYAALWCKSNFSFLEGASHPDELVEEAQRLGLRAVALTDRDGVHGIVNAHVKARELGLQLVIGAQVTLDDESTLILLAQDRRGYANLCRLLTAGRRRSPKGISHVGWSEACHHAPGLVALWGGEQSRIVQAENAAAAVAATAVAAAGDAGLDCDAVAEALRGAFGDRLYALAARHRRAEDVAGEARLRRRASRHGLPIAAAIEVLYHTPARRPLQDVLTCIRHGVNVHTAGRRTKPNAEHALVTAHAFARLFADDPLAVARTMEVAERCTFSLAELRYRYPSEQLPGGMTSSQWLRHLTFDGAARRYGERVPDDVTRQLERELAVIDELDYCGYFIGMWEIVEFCRSQGILCQGRGSAANSAVCYCLHITAVDPVRMGLLFERFISRERAEPPDIDLDIEHERREEIIQHVYTKYGRERAAMVANVVRYRARSALRDVGKALGFAEADLLRLSKLYSHYDGVGDGGMRHAGFDVATPQVQRLLELAREIQDFPRHLSIHPGGFLLGHEAVTTLVPIENATMPGRTVIQWDKNDVEALGLFKVDLLGLGALTHLHACFDLLRRHRGVELDMARIPADDAATFAMIQRADTVGVFQIESRAQMAMLPRLRPRNYYDLVIEVSIVRPGPITGGMVHPYLRRRNGEEEVEYPHEMLRPVLEKTLGVPLFQEQVMRLAVVAADYTPGEADQLRRDMAAWRRSGRLEQHHERLVSRMQKNGIALEFAERVFKQICGFGEYGFPESHAASFALISYAGSWLRRHYPAEFTCALLNAQPMGFYSVATIVEDAKRHGIEMRPIDVTQSAWDCTLEPLQYAAASERGGLAPTPFAVRMGLRFVKGLRRTEGDRITEAAAARRFASVDDFVARTELAERVLATLAQAGVFEGLGVDRRQAFWRTRGLVRAAPIALPLDSEREPEFAPLDALEIVAWDYTRSHHSTRGHPLQPLRAALQAAGLPDARTVAGGRHGDAVRYAGIVICRQRPGTASGVTFMTLEDETGFVNVVVWRQVFEQYAIVLKTEPFLGISGRLQVEREVVHLIASSLWKPQLSRTPVSGGSRDFH